MNAVMNKVREYAENEKNEFKDIKVYEATQKVQVEINRKELKKQLKKFEDEDVMVDLIGEVSTALFINKLEIEEFKDIGGNHRVQLSGIDEVNSVIIDLEDVYYIREDTLCNELDIYFKSGTELEIALNE